MQPRHLRFALLVLAICSTLSRAIAQQCPKANTVKACQGVVVQSPCKTPAVGTCRVNRENGCACFPPDEPSPPPVLTAADVRIDMAEERVKKLQSDYVATFQKLPSWDTLVAEEKSTVGKDSENWTFIFNQGKVAQIQHKWRGNTDYTATDLVHEIGMDFAQHCTYANAASATSTVRYTTTAGADSPFNIIDLICTDVAGDPHTLSAQELGAGTLRSLEVRITDTKNGSLGPFAANP